MGEKEPGMSGRGRKDKEAEPVSTSSVGVGGGAQEEVSFKEVNVCVAGKSLIEYLEGIGALLHDDEKVRIMSQGNIVREIIPGSSEANTILKLTDEIDKLTDRIKGIVTTINNPTPQV